MRRSFSSGSHSIASGSTKILRTVTTSVTRPTTNPSTIEPFKSANSPSSASPQSLSSSYESTTTRNLPISAVTNPILNYYRPSFTSPTSSSVGDEFEWLEEGGGDYEVEFGPPPSVDEIEAAVSSLRQVIDPESFSRLVQYGYGSNGDSGGSDSSSSGSEVDWIEPPLMQMYGSRMMNSPESSRVFDAFRLLQTDAAIQRMVVSLSSDRAVWNAVLNNAVVRELRGSLDPGLSEPSSVARDSDGSSCGAANLLTRIFVTAKLKVMEIFDMINNIVNNLFKSLETELPMRSNPLEEKLRQSVMLTVMVLLIVVMTRGNMA